MSSSRLPINFQQAIKFILKMLQFFGLCSNYFKMDSWYYAFYSIVVLVMVILQTGNRLWFLISSRNDLFNFISGSTLIFAEYVIYIKGFCFFLKWNDLLGIIEISENVNFRARNEQQLNIANSGLNNWKIFAKSFGTLTALTTVLVAISPFLRTNYRAYMPLEMKTFCDYQQPYLYEFFYLHQLFILAFLLVVTVSIDTLMAGVMVFIGIQCDILSDSLKNMHLFAVERVQNNSHINLTSEFINKEICTIFVECIEHHRQIIM